MKSPPRKIDDEFHSVSILSCQVFGSPLSFHLPSFNSNLISARWFIPRDTFPAYRRNLIFPRLSKTGGSCHAPDTTTREKERTLVPTTLSFLSFLSDKSFLLLFRSLVFLPSRAGLRASLTSTYSSEHLSLVITTSRLENSSRILFRSDLGSILPNNFAAIFSPHVISIYFLSLVSPINN